MGKSIWINLKLTQPVLLQSYSDEFDLQGGRKPKTPAESGQVLQHGEPENDMDQEKQGTYSKGVGKLLHMMRWSRPEILNSVSELSRYMTGGNEKHLKCMHRVVQYCVETPKRGLTLNSDTDWDGSQ